MAHRISSLPLAESCGLAPTLHTFDMIEGRQSTAFHAKAAGDPRWKAIADALPDALRDELDAWIVPATLPSPWEHIPWASLTHETEITLALTGSVGHPDAWCIVGDSNDGTAIVVDIKRTRWTARIDSLQMHGYGYALAAEYGAKRYALVHYYPTEGAWLRGPTVEMGTMDALIIADRLIAAASNTSPMTGPHCDDCYSRHKCPTYTVDAAAVADMPGADALTVDDDASAREAFRRLTAAKSIVKSLEPALRSYALSQGGAVDLGGGYRYSQSAPSMAAGFDMKRLKAEHPELAAQYAIETPRAGSWRRLKG